MCQKYSLKLKGIYCFYSLVIFTQLYWRFGISRQSEFVLCFLSVGGHGGSRYWYEIVA